MYRSFGSGFPVASVPAPRASVNAIIADGGFVDAGDVVAPEDVGRYAVERPSGWMVLFGDGWGLVRASNTQPALVVRFEARTPERLAEIRALFMVPLARLGVGEATVGH